MSDARRSSAAVPLHRRSLLLSGLALPLGVASSVAAAPSRSAQDEVWALMMAQQAAWNRGDIAGFCAPYADDCVFLSPGGLSRGRKTVEDRYIKKYGAAKATMGQLEFSLLDSRSTVDGVSLAMRWTLRWPDLAPPKPSATGLTLIVWQRQADGWRLVQDASM